MRFKCLCNIHQNRHRLLLRVKPAKAICYPDTALKKSRCVAAGAERNKDWTPVLYLSRKKAYCGLDTRFEVYRRVRGAPGLSERKVLLL